MTSFFSWYLILTLLGWLTFPLVHRLFPALSDRGFTLARAAGMLIWGYVFWLFTSLGFSRNDLGGILFALAILIALSIWSLITDHFSLITFLKSNKLLILTTELLFLLAFAFLAFLRAANSELASTEKPMELMFINSIMQSETFPPQDAWLSGYAISYYYFGYVMTAMLARLSNLPGSLAHNLMTSLIFALGAVGSFGIVYNLLAQSPISNLQSSIENRQSKIVNRKSSIANSLLAPLFLLLVSNFEALLEVFHRLGLGWTKNSETGEWTGAFWTWLDMKELSQPPAEPLGWIPDRYLWWWRASRVIQDYDIAGGHREVIDEFPFFSFLLGDLHPHVLAIPFGLLAVSVALNIFLGGWRGGKLQLLGAKLEINLPGFLFAALTLGGLAFLNTWDILTGAALIVFAYVLWRASENGWNGSRFEDVLLLSLPLGILALLLYLPFYFGFSSQAGGLLPNFMYPTRGAHLWVMWGTLLIPIFAFLLYRWIKEPPRPNWKLGLTIGLGLTLILSLLALLLGWIGSIVERDFVNATLASFNMTASQFLAETSLRRLNHIGGLLTILAVLVPAVSMLFGRNEKREASNEERVMSNEAKDSSLVTHHSSLSFPLLLLTLGALLLLAPEFVYLRDQFGYRINTIFKFYYQTWMLWSLAAAFGAAFLLQRLRGLADLGVRSLMGLVIFCGLLYPALGVWTKTDNFKPYFGYNLDDFTRIQRENPDDAAGIAFLQTQPEGVVAEVVGGSYSYYARVSTYTGFPAVMGWPGHESQWRGGNELHGSRENDIETLYVTARWEDAQAVIERYNIRYIFIGSLERISVNVNEEKFALYLKPIFRQGSTTVYQAP
jgi:YYY domain-containing protein